MSLLAIKNLNKSQRTQFSRYGGVGLELGVSVVVGYMLGRGLDRWLETTWIAKAGLFMGILAGARALWRLTQSYRASLQEDRDSEQTTQVKP